jgi:hypothetical protein
MKILQKNRKDNFEKKEKEIQFLNEIDTNLLDNTIDNTKTDINSVIDNITKDNYKILIRNIYNEHFYLTFYKVINDKIFFINFLRDRINSSENVYEYIYDFSYRNFNISELEYFSVKEDRLFLNFIKKEGLYYYYDTNSIYNEPIKQKHKNSILFILNKVMNEYYKKNDIMIKE